MDKVENLGLCKKNFRVFMKEFDVEIGRLHKYKNKVKLGDEFPLKEIVSKEKPIIIDSKSVVPVDYELIRRLRAEGKYMEASNLVKAHHETVKKGWNEVRRQKRFLSHITVYFARKNKRICVYCGKKKAVNNSVLCEVCKERQNKKSITTKDRRILHNLCTRCGKRKPEQGYKTCSECKRKTKEISLTRIRAGLCSNCGENKLTDQFITCKKCREKNKEKWKKKM